MIPLCKTILWTVAVTAILGGGIVRAVNTPCQITGPDDLCGGDTGTYTANTTDPDAPIFSWGVTGAADNPDVDPSNTGTATIKAYNITGPGNDSFVINVNYTDSNGLQNNCSKTVTVHPNNLYSASPIVWSLPTGVKSRIPNVSWAIASYGMWNGSLAAGANISALHYSVVTASANASQTGTIQIDYCGGTPPTASYTAETTGNVYANCEAWPLAPTTASSGASFGVSLSGASESDNDGCNCDYLHPAAMAPGNGAVVLSTPSTALTGPTTVTVVRSVAAHAQASLWVGAGAIANTDASASVTITP